ncbi:MAG: hypothetical protein ACRDY2_12095 [Acidimicrobiales bacterium]
MEVIRYLAGSGLPAPLRQHTIVCASGAIVRVDMAWPEARLAVELDSEAWHDTPRAYHQDKARSLRLASAGWEVLAITPRNLREGSGADLVAAIRRRLPSSGPRVG